MTTRRIFRSQSAPQYILTTFVFKKRASRPAGRNRAACLGPMVLVTSVRTPWGRVAVVEAGRKPLETLGNGWKFPEGLGNLPEASVNG